MSISNQMMRSRASSLSRTHTFSSVSTILGDPEASNSDTSSGADPSSRASLATEESSYLKLKPFTELDPTLNRLLNFFNCFGLMVNFVQSKTEKKQTEDWRLNVSRRSQYLKVVLVLIVLGISGEVVFDINLGKSRLLAEQKKSTPLLTFVIVAYYWLSVVLPVICDLSLVFCGSSLFRFYSRATATVCNGRFFGKRTSVDGWLYYFTMVFVVLLDAIGQIIVIGVWPSSLDPYMKLLLSQDKRNNSFTSHANHSLLHQESHSMSSPLTDENSYHFEKPKIKTYVIDSILGDELAHGDLGVCIKVLCLMIQQIHSYAFLMIILSLANHYATIIKEINKNLDKYKFRRLLKQLIVLRDSSEQISLMISIPLAQSILLVFVRQIAINGVFIQSTMLPFENWALVLQSMACSVSIFMVFIYCDGLQSASKQTHRLKTEQIVMNDKKGGNQLTYEFLDYLNRLSLSIRITFFNIIAINKATLVSLYGHILTLIFVTS